MTIVSLDALISGARAGKLVSFPTDTVPALACLPEKSSLIYAAKQRSREKPLILMAARTEDIWAFTQGRDEEYQVWHEVAKKYWPGALTLVLPASERVPKVTISSSNENFSQYTNQLSNSVTVGVRVPDSAIARKILAQTGPLATTSINLSGQPPLLTVSEIEAQFPELLCLAATEYDTEVKGTGLPSTVVKWTGENWQVLRQGAIKIEF
ncbi:MULTISPECIES: L-threonylcarbamoyladenylate synthase [Nostocales]|uniref:L-threonylcarbamoyladenylate synthase n=3 Tax=Nostocales TaxID=1161 RepID=A0A0C1NF60_9CYAN|nr:L-threonylcarbamoyladenylate synthase [Tolypothrix bouteillei]KAF3887772.1 L-threonylcarbamoyladenylate synthase [Tolypothrix bouteillei VB521301]